MWHNLILTKKNPLPGYAGFTFLFWIWIREDYFDEILYNHELIHMRQQYELLFVGQWILYGWYYVRNRIRGYGHDLSYRFIPFEKEAYFHDEDMDYLDKRKRFAWRQYA